MAAAPPLPRSSPTARLALAILLALLVYASLFPNRGWTHPGISALAWLRAPIPPPYWTTAEIVSNVLVYIPLGTLLVWALRPRVLGWKAVVAATLAAAFVSGLMESLQTFLPDRIASNLDFATNTSGAFLGAVLGALFARSLIDDGRHTRWSERALLPHTRTVSLLVAAWVMVQVAPQSMLFGTGDIASLIGRNLLPLQEWVPLLANPAPHIRVLAEFACTALAIVGVSMLLLHCLRATPLRALWVPLVIGAAVAVKALTMPFTILTPASALTWFTPGAARGLAVGVLIAMILGYAPRKWQRRLAILALVLQVLLVNLFPLNLYFLSTVSVGRTDLLYMETLARELAVVWPLVALGWMAFSRGSRQAARKAVPERAANESVQ